MTKATTATTTAATPKIARMPRGPWQLGKHENTNGRLRDYFPEGMDFKPITQARLDAVAAKLNRRPRQTLGWVSPSEKFTEVVR